MVPKVAKQGKSFKGAAAYYLHDKGADTRERVAFTHTVNLPTDDPDLAWRLMAQTALSANDLKVASGQKMTGNKTRSTVYSYSLSWQPGLEPSHEHMLAMAQQTLDVLGLSEHQSLIVAHNDTEHPHIHVIVNRVHPETGLTPKGQSNDHRKLSRWARAYTKEHGLDVCPQREANARKLEEQANKPPAQREFIKYSEKNPREFWQWRKERMNRYFARQKAQRESLSEKYAERRAELNQMKEGFIKDKQDAINAAAKKRWAALYREQRDERRRLAFVKTNNVSRLRTFLRGTIPRDPWADKWRHSKLVGAAFDQAADTTRFEAGIHARQKDERRALGKEIDADLRAVLTASDNAFKAAFDNIAQEERDEKAELAQRQTAESEHGAAEIASGTLAVKYDAARNLLEDWQKTGAEAAPDSSRQDAAAPDFESLSTAWEVANTGNQAADDADATDEDRDTLTGGGGGKDTQAVTPVAAPAPATPESLLDAWPDSRQDDPAKAQTPDEKPPATTENTETDDERIVREGIAQLFEQAATYEFPEHEGRDDPEHDEDDIGREKRGPEGPKF